MKPFSMIFMGIIVTSHHSLHNTNSSATARPASAAPQPQLSCAVVRWSGVSPAQQLQPGAGAIQQQQIFCTNLANSTGVKYTSVLSRVCLCVTVQEGDILLYISSINSAVLLSPVLPRSMLLVSGIPNHDHQPPTLHCRAETTDTAQQRRTSLIQNCPQ